MWVERAISGFAVAAMVLSASPGPAHANTTSRGGGTQDWIVVLDSDQATSAPAHARRHGIRPAHVYRAALNGYSARLSRAEASALRREPGVRSVERDRPVWATAQNVPTGLDRTTVPDTPGLGGSTIGDGIDDRVDVDIAIIDTGSGPHPDLNVVARADCRTATCVDGFGLDGNGHGTHVAGTAAALDNGIGVVGVAPGARIWSVQVLEASGSGTLAGVIAGIDYVTARADRIDVANISIGCNCVSTAIDAALARANAAGVTIAVAAGNDALDTSPFSIANSPNVITTSALADFNGVSGGGGAPTCRFDVDDTLADFSNYGQVVDLAAPGVCIRSTWLGAGYATISGTSMASPHVAGAAALLASTPAYAGDPTAIQTRLEADGNLGWVDTSGDGAQEPLLDVTGLVPGTVPAAEPLHLSVDNAWVAEGATAQMTVRTSRPLVGGEVVTATVATKKGTAVNGQDYTHVSAAAVRLEAGQDQVTVPVQTLSDAVREGTETFTVTLSKVTGAALADSSATITIYDLSGQLSMSIGDVTAPEGSSPVAEVRLSEPVPAGSSVTAKLTALNGTATSGADYTPIPTQTLSFPAGTQTLVVPLTFAVDSLHELDETFTLTLSSLSGARAADSSATVTIVDAQGPIHASLSNAWTAEGDSGATSLPFVVSLSEPPGAGQTVTVTVKTLNSSATAGSDYIALPSTLLTFTPGETSKPVPVTVNGDTTIEGSETLKLSATSSSGAVLADDLGYGTIANDDGATPVPPLPTLSVGDAFLTETGPGQSAAVVLTLSAPPGPGESVTAYVSSANGTAESGADYRAVPSTPVTFAEGQSTAAVPVTALADAFLEPQETFTLNVSSVVGAAAVDPTGTVRVASDQPPPQARVEDLWLAEGDSGQVIADVTVRLSAPPAFGQSVSLVAATSPSTASSGSDFVAVSPTTLVFGPGVTTGTVSVALNGDTAHEGVESFSLTLSAPSGLAIEDTYSTVSLVDEEGPITARLVEGQSAEGNSGLSTGYVTVQLSQPVAANGQSFTVKLASTTGGTAAAGTDYVTLALTTFALTAGQDRVTVPVTVIGDGTVEQHETVRVTASSPTGGLVLADATADLTILNDDG